MEGGDRLGPQELHHGIMQAQGGIDLMVVVMQGPGFAVLEGKERRNRSIYGLVVGGEEKVTSWMD